jgi:hypothetical protein
MSNKFYELRYWNGSRGVEEFPNIEGVIGYIKGLPETEKARYREVSEREARRIKRELAREEESKKDEILTRTLLDYNGMRKVPRFF